MRFRASDVCSLADGPVYNQLYLRPGGRVFGLGFLIEATVTEWLDCSLSTKANRIQTPAGSLLIFASGNRTGRCRWSVDFLEEPSFPPPFHSSPALFSPHFTLIGYQDIAVNSQHSKLSTEQRRNARAGNRKTPEKTRRPAASFSKVPTCENPGGKYGEAPNARAGENGRTPRKPSGIVRHYSNVRKSGGDPAGNEITASSV
ncbi:hypothetical protein PR048_021221 [Dryococelus australis]|uniref:Uncharacterized protein n=1 Tax=Dryococelus australis TaxID=614101 RepID=A0ABQ9GXK2_9NEOP|nr:hypothetical protein PR048_021221 [Dryococelus australis]